MKILYSFIALTLLGGLLFPQSNQRVFEKMSKTKLDLDEKVQSPTNDNLVNNEIERKPIDHVFIGKMWNAYSTQGSYKNQIFTNPYSNLITVTHRGSRLFPHSGVIVNQPSDDGRANWTAQFGPMGSINFLGRHPNIAISNPTKSTIPGE